MLAGLMILFRHREKFFLPADLSLSDAGLAAIKREEGFRSKTYFDAAGLATIGYGHLITSGEAFPAGISEPDAEKLLREDVQIAETSIRSNVIVPLTQSMFDALVSFVFNVGAGAFKTSTLLKILNGGDYAAAAQEFSRWHIAGGKPGVLAARRTREAGAFMAGIA